MASAVIGSLRVNLGIDTAAFSDGLKNAGSKLAGFGSVLRSAIVPLAAAGTAALVGVGAAVKGTIDAADEMSKAASKFGVPIEELSRLKYAADLSDVSLEGLGTSLGRLSKNMVSAATGAGPMAKAFDAAGISVKNADGSLRSSTDVLGQLADKLSTMPDGAQKTALAIQLLGKSGAEMIPLLNGGSAALAEMGKEAETFGQVFSSATGTNAEAFNDNITRLQGALSSTSAEIAARVLPSLVSLTDLLVENGPKIAEFAGFFVDLGTKIATFGVNTVAALTDARTDIAIWRDGVVEGATAAGGAVVQFGQDAIGALTTFVSGLAAKVEEIRGYFAGIRDQMVQVGQQVIDGLLAGLQAKWESVKAWFSGLASALPQWLKDAWGIHSPSRVFADIGRNVMEGLSQGIGSLTGQVSGDVGTFGQNLASTFADILTGATDWRDALRNVLSSVGGQFLNAGIGGLGKAIGIPGFARGTNYAPGGLALVGENGPELVNLPRGSKVTPNGGFGGGGQVAVRVYVDQGGNWQAAVAGIAGQVSAQVVRQSAPRVVANSVRRNG